MTEPFYICLVMGALYLTILIARASTTHQVDLPRHHTLRLFLILGLVLGAAVLLRQLVLLLVPGFFAWLWWVRRKHRPRETLAYFAATSVVIGFLILPFSLYNFSRFGHFVLLNTNSGYAFFWANHPVQETRFEGILTRARYQDLIPPEYAHLDEAELDQALLRLGLGFVVDDPVRYVALSISRIPVYFMFWPSSDSGLVSNLSRVASFGLLWPFMLYGILRYLIDLKRTASGRDASEATGLLLFITGYTAIHLLSWALIRYRLPVDAVALVFAGLALVDLRERVPWPNKLPAIAR
jgi:hypothetical protein